MSVPEPYSTVIARALQGAHRAHQRLHQAVWEAHPYVQVRERIFRMLPLLQVIPWGTTKQARAQQQHVLLLECTRTTHRCWLYYHDGIRDHRLVDTVYDLADGQPRRVLRVCRRMEAITEWYKRRREGVLLARAHLLGQQAGALRTLQAEVDAAALERLP